MSDYLVIEDLSITVANKQLLSDINLVIERGCPVTIIGESGAGKTTLAKALMGCVIGEVQGKIDFNGCNILTQNQQELRDYRHHNIGLVLQNMGESLNPQLSVMVHLLECLDTTTYSKKHSGDKVRAHEMLTAFHVPKSLWHRRPKGLSGGEIQRVLLAMAMMNDPELLILDEPSSALDQSLRDLLAGYLDILRQNRYLILISHDLALAKQVKGAVAVMQQGRIVEWGGGQQVFSTPIHPYTQALINTTHNIDSKPLADTVYDGDQIHHLPYLSLFAISKSFAHRKVLKSIDVTLYRGEVVALLGRSGQGKSTLAMIISGALQPDSGDITKYVNPLNIAWVSQHPSRALAPHFSLFDAIAEPLILQKQPQKSIHERVIKVLKQVKMTTDSEQLQQRINRFSGGELQRIDLARALITKPHIIIADEITASLDYQTRTDIIQLLLDLKNNTSLTVLLITHDKTLAKATADRCLHLCDGDFKCRSSDLI